MVLVRGGKWNYHFSSANQFQWYEQMLHQNFATKKIFFPTLEKNWLFFPNKKGSKKLLTENVLLST